tara:strand:+ start:1483 stop:1878 length:396 start_codon:yes stop_codon:yes gene_type:complete
MPVLQLKLTPSADGTTKVTLDRTLKAQNMRLTKAVIVRSDNTTYTGTHISVELPFLAGYEIHTNSRRGALDLPVDKDKKHADIDFNLNLGAENIQDVFIAKLCDNNGAGLTSASNIQAVFLYFDYTSNELF